MSVYVTGLAMDSRQRSAAHKLALLALADGADETGKVLGTPMDKIARFVSTGTLAAEELLGDLVADGWVRHEHFGPHGPGLLIDVAKLEAAAG